MNRVCSSWPRKPATRWSIGTSWIPARTRWDLLKKLLERFGSRLNYVVVLNQLRGDNFDLFDQSGAREKLAELGSPVITLKRLHEPVINKIDAGSTSFWAAKHRSETEGKGLGILERQRVKMWLNSAYAELERAGV